MSNEININQSLNSDVLFNVFELLLESKDFQASTVCALWNNIFHSVAETRIGRLTNSATLGILDIPTRKEVEQFGLPGLKEYNLRVLSSAGLPLTRETLLIETSQVEQTQDQYSISLLTFWNELSNRWNFGDNPKPQTVEEITQWLNDPVNSERLKEVKSLTINDPAMTILPTEIACLPNLEWLTLTHTSIKFLCPQIAALSSLQVLDLSSTPLKALPDNFNELRSLWSLNIDRTDIDAIPKSVEELQTNGALKRVISKFSSTNQLLGPIERLKRDDSEILRISQAKRRPFSSFNVKRD